MEEKARKLIEFIDGYAIPFCKTSVCIENYQDAAYPPFYEDFIPVFKRIVIDGCVDGGKNELSEAKRVLDKLTDSRKLKTAKKETDKEISGQAYYDPIERIRRFRNDEEEC